MSRIHRTPSKSPAKKPEAKAQAPKHQPTKRVAEDIARLEKAKNAEVSGNEKEGWSSRTRTTRRKDTTTTSTLKKTEGNVLDSTFEYTRTTSKPGLERVTSFSTATDMVGRRSSQQSTRTDTEAEGRADSKTSTKSTDIWGIEKRTLEKSSDVALENGSLHQASRTARDSRGNRITASEFTRVETQDKTTVTTTGKREKGSELDTRSSTTWENGVFRLSDSADWKKTNSFEKGSLRETEYDASRFKQKADKLGGAVDKVLEWLELDPAEWKSEVPADRMHEKAFHEGENSYLGARYGISGGQSVSFDGKGVDASFRREAVAGVYANAQGRTGGRFGEASYDARAKAEASASVDARGRLDSNGLQAQVDARVGATIEVDITAEARTKSVTLLGTPVDASVQAHGRAVAEAVAEATGTVAITRNPPTAIAKGTLGASAVAKAEGEIRLSAGPFSVVANGYVNAGAEAKATGVLGYEDGKLKIGGSIGAALGVGAGGGVTVEVDVRAIGQMAKNAADVNHDGTLDWKDAFEAVKRTANFVMPGFGLAHLMGGASPSRATTPSRTFLDPSAFGLPKIRRGVEE
ncbi:MAG: hypothetical protein AB1730_26015 [Myxococcota bacterium]